MNWSYEKFAVWIKGGAAGLLNNSIPIVAGGHQTKPKEVVPKASEPSEHTWLYDGKEWSIGHNMGLYREYTTGVAIGNDFYSIGARDQNRVFRYSLATGKWDANSVRPLPTAFSVGAVAAYGRSLLIAGGYGGRFENEVPVPWVRKLDLDNQARGWQDLPKLPVALASGAGVVARDAFYIVGGLSCKPNCKGGDPQMPNRTFHNEIYKLDLRDSAATWVLVGRLGGETCSGSPETCPGVQGAGVVAYQDRFLIVVGGAKKADYGCTTLQPCYYNQLVWIYDIDKGTGAVASVAPSRLKKGSNDAMTILLGDEILNIGGENVNKPTQNTSGLVRRGKIVCTP